MFDDIPAGPCTRPRTPSGTAWPCVMAELDGDDLTPLRNVIDGLVAKRRLHVLVNDIT